jgi:hypothetical protein
VALGGYCATGSPDFCPACIENGGPERMDLPEEEIFLGCHGNFIFDMTTERSFGLKRVLDGGG